MRSGFAGVIIAGAVMCRTPVAGAQSLADAATRAEEQRQAHPDAPRLTDHDVDLARLASNQTALGLELTMPMIQRYCGVRTALLRVMVRSPGVAGEIQRAPGRAGRDGVDGLVREYTEIPAAVEVIEAGPMTVREYTVTEVAFMAAVGVLAGKLPMPKAGVVAANVEFLERHQAEIEALWQEALRLEAQLAR